MPTDYDPSDLIWLVEAADLYHRSRGYMESLIEPGPRGEPAQLSHVVIPGDKKKYMLRSELERFFQGQIIKGKLYRAGVESDGDERDGDEHEHGGQRVG